MRDEHLRDEHDDSDMDEVLPVRRRPREKDLGDEPLMRMVMPIGLSGWAIASGYLGLFSVLFLPAPLALVTGVLAIREIRRNPKKHGMGRAIFGIVMGSVGTVAILVVLVAFILDRAWGI